MSDAPPSVSMTPASADWPLALAGVVTGFAGLAASQVVATLMRTRVTPLVAVGESVRDLTPGGVAHFLIGLVGTYDKPLLLGGTVVLMIAISAFAGLQSRRHPLITDLIFLALAGVGLLAVMSAPGAEVGSGLAVVAGAITWIVVFRLLSGGVERAESGDRRAFLRRAGLITGAGIVALVVGQVAGRGRQAVQEARALLRLPGTRGRVPQGAQIGVPGIAPWRSPNDGFYLIDTALVKPVVRPAEWRLRVHGMVEHEVEITFDQLIEREQTEGWITLACVSNEVGGDLIGNAWWTGVPVREILEMAGVKAGADAVLQTSQDGWTCVTPIEALTDDRNALLAVAMNGQPLPIEHGFPVRVVVPGLYGYVSATKWVVDFKVTTFADDEGFWTPRGWSERGPIKTQSRIDVPRQGASVEVGEVAFGGVAWAQQTGIEKVEFSVDGGEWIEAKLGRVPSTDTWVQWSGIATVGRGEHEVRVRATDKSGYTQTPVLADVVPNGATGWHTVRFSA